MLDIFGKKEEAPKNTFVYADQIEQEETAKKEMEKAEESKDKSSLSFPLSPFFFFFPFCSFFYDFSLPSSSEGTQRLSKEEQKAKDERTVFFGNYPSSMEVKKFKAFLKKKFGEVSEKENERREKEEEKHVAHSSLNKPG